MGALFLLNKELDKPFQYMVKHQLSTFTQKGPPGKIAGRPEFTGAGNEIRTRDPRLGKPVLYH